MSDCPNPKCLAAAGSPCVGRKGQTLNWRHAGRLPDSGPASTAPEAGPAGKIIREPLPVLKADSERTAAGLLGRIASGSGFTQ